MLRCLRISIRATGYCCSPLPPSLLHKQNTISSSFPLDARRALSSYSFMLFVYIFFRSVFLIVNNATAVLRRTIKLPSTPVERSLTHFELSVLTPPPPVVVVVVVLFPFICILFTSHPLGSRICQSRYLLHVYFSHRLPRYFFF